MTRWVETWISPGKPLSTNAVTELILFFFLYTYYTSTKVKVLYIYICITLVFSVVIDLWKVKVIYICSKVIYFSFLSSVRAFWGEVDNGE